MASWDWALHPSSPPLKLLGLNLLLNGIWGLLGRFQVWLLERLDPRIFQRIHRSAIVNLEFILEFQPWTSGDQLVIRRDGTRLTLSPTYRNQVGERESQKKHVATAKWV
jgi:hypothetical protein